jgi:heat shock protein HtpX
MPITFIDIERQKTYRIGFFFIFLLLLYYLVAVAFAQGLFFVFPILFLKADSIFIWNSPHILIIVFVFCVVFALLHSYLSGFNAVKTVLRNIEAIPPDTNDGIHKSFVNVINEIEIVNGCSGKIKPMVIPSLSLNAIAVSDLKGDSAIAITEGLLSRLSRQQLEAVVAHESYHILSGDCLEATVATGLFGLYASMLDKLQSFGEDEKREGGLHSAFLLFWILVKLSHLLNLFISREREYRADAAAVKMTRNPIALAEALYLISNNWKGAGFIGDGLEMLCMVNPKESEIEESEGFWANLLSTHPPIEKRIKILLSMAHLTISDLENRFNVEHEKDEKEIKAEDKYYILDKNQQWQGPFHISELKEIPWFSPMTWIKRTSSNEIERASEDDALKLFFETHILYKHDKYASDLRCPLCKEPLLKIPYERTYIFRCHYCKGSLVDNDKISRILARREERFDERIALLEKAVQEDNKRAMVLRKTKGIVSGNRRLLNCPKCQNPMMRRFYSLVYLVEIDRCGLCNVTWFDNDELEILQYITEMRFS